VLVTCNSHRYVAVASPCTMSCNTVTYPTGYRESVGW